MLKLSMLFSDHMVLQRGKPIPVWGEATAGTRVTVALDGAQAEALADESGRWIAYLPAQEAGTGFCLRVTDGQEELVLRDVCIGEVWLAGGQSNM